MPPRSADAAREAADLRVCESLIRQGSRSFFNASRVLPAGVRGPAYALYAFCRTADDAVDLVPSERVPDALAGLHRRLDRVYAGCPGDDAVERAFARTVERYALPRALPEALLDGFAWDATGRRYADIGELRAYGVRVAGSVGAMMTMLMGVRTPAVIARAVDLGVAMQLTNIARDVGEDARAGRLYLPSDWLLEAGIDPDRWLAEPRFGPALASVIERVLREADSLYRQAGPGIGQLPVGCRPGIRAAQLLYSEIGRELERRGLDSVGRRAVVGGRRKLALIGWSLLTSQHVLPGLAVPPLAEAQFLVEAVAGTPSPRPCSRGSVSDGAAWTVDLLTRLERADRSGRPGLSGAPVG